MAKPVGHACHKCIHSQTTKENAFVFCSFWVEIVHRLHACTYYENEKDGFFQSLKPYDQEKYRKMVKWDLAETHRIKFSDDDLDQARESHKRHVERIDNAF